LCTKIAGRRFHCPLQQKEKYPVIAGNSGIIFGVLVAVVTLGASGPSHHPAAAELHIRAERRMGEELEKTELAKGAAVPGTARGTTRSPEGTASAPTLAEIGITKKQSARYQQVAAIPEEVFEAAIEGHKEAGQIVTAASAARAAVETEERPDVPYRALVTEEDTALAARVTEVRTRKAKAHPEGRAPGAHRRDSAKRAPARTKRAP
jgi:hypothetical protein